MSVYVILCAKLYKNIYCLFVYYDTVIYTIYRATAQYGTLVWNPKSKKYIFYSKTEFSADFESIDIFQIFLENPKISNLPVKHIKTEKYFSYLNWLYISRTYFVCLWEPRQWKNPKHASADYTRNPKQIYPNNPPIFPVISRNDSEWTNNTYTRSYSRKPGTVNSESPPDSYYHTNRISRLRKNYKRHSRTPRPNRDRNHRSHRNKNNRTRSPLPHNR